MSEASGEEVRVRAREEGWIDGPLPELEPRERKLDGKEHGPVWFGLGEFETFGNWLEREGGRPREDQGALGHLASQRCCRKERRYRGDGDTAALGWKKHGMRRHGLEKGKQ